MNGRIQTDKDRTSRQSVLTKGITWVRGEKFRDGIRINVAYQGYM